MQADASVASNSPSAAQRSDSAPFARADGLTNASADVSPLGLLHILRTVGPSLFGHAELYSDLMRVEWALERWRLQRMLVLGLFGFSCWLALMLLTVIAALLLSWPTPYRIAVIGGLFGVFGVGLVYARYRLRQLSRAGQQSFAVLREELAADLALLRQRL